MITCVEGTPSTKFGVFWLLLALLDCTPGVSDISAYAVRVVSGRPLISSGETVRPSSALAALTSGPASGTAPVWPAPPTPSPTFSAWARAALITRFAARQRFRLAP